MGKSPEIMGILFYFTKEIELKNTNENQYTENQVKEKNSYFFSEKEYRAETGHHRSICKLKNYKTVM